MRKRAVRLIFLILLGWSFFSFASQATKLLEKADKNWQKRSNRYCLERSKELYLEAYKLDPLSYETNWRLCRFFVYLADILDEKDKAQRKKKTSYAKTAISYGEKAVELDPCGIEGHYYLALAIGQYSLGISVIKALRKGLGSKFLKHINFVLEKKEDFEKGGPLRAIGRYWYKLPWPKRDLKKSLFYLKKAAFIAPRNVRGYVYLAETLLKMKKKKEAKDALLKAIQLEPDLTFEPEAFIWKERAKKILIKHFPKAQKML